MWSPKQYERFKSERRQPFEDLSSLIEKRPRMRVLDLGCGTGELTRELHLSLEAAETLGIDNSETMLRKADGFREERLRFEKTDIEAFETDKPYDLIFSNAVLHWIPSHETLFRRMTGFLSSAGQIAVQMPSNDDHPSHLIAAETATLFGLEPRPRSVLGPAQYALLLHRLGYQRQHVRLQVYTHLLPSSADVVEWVRGALLTHYEALLGPERFTSYLEAYRDRLAASLGDHEPYLYTYERVLIWGSVG